MTKKARNKTPWPTKDAMTQIYEKHLWGGQAEAFYSGDGSHNLAIVRPYVEAVSTFLNSFDEPLSICDLGCGDFNVGKQLVEFATTYTAIDIVPSLIERNESIFISEGLRFQCLDIAQDELPKADCAIVRQVLQHLSNAEIAAVANKLKQFKYVILTEHLPVAAFEPNIDIISGQGIRLKKKSGVVLTAAPFNFQCKSETNLLEIELPEGNGRIVTILFEVY